MNLSRTKPTAPQCPTWPALRSGLAADLGVADAQALADLIGYSDADHVAQALAGAEPRDDLVMALLRHYPTVPALYFLSARADSARRLRPNPRRQPVRATILPKEIAA